MGELIKENPDFKTHFSLHFVGIVNDQIKDFLSFYKLGDFVVYHGYKPHQEAIQFQKNAQLLLLLEVNSKQHKGIIPGKLFEYMASETPILGIGPVDWEVANMVAESQTGAVYAYSEKEALKAYILACYSSFKNGVLQEKSQHIEKYNRKVLTGELAKILHTWDS